MLFLCQLLLNFQGAYTLIEVRSLSNNYIHRNRFLHALVSPLCIR